VTTDLSGLIFVALAVAWAAYLIPKALRHHEDVVRGRSVDRFSHSMRVLARREPVSARSARLVVTPPRDEARRAPLPSPEEQYAARRIATRQATKRRRRVLGVRVLAIGATIGAAVLHRHARPYLAIPTGLLLAWLVACRLMVRQERRWHPVEQVDTDLTGEIVPVPADASDAAETPPEARDPKLWDPVPVTLPTYVSKPPARRTVRTIDLDATGVWTSGRTEADSALARDAEAADRVRRRASRKDEASDEAVGT
jgi:hypothetical protein